jgi:hypothetical protein
MYRVRGLLASYGPSSPLPAIPTQCRLHPVARHDCRGRRQFPRASQFAMRAWSNVRFPPIPAASGIVTAFDPLRTLGAASGTVPASSERRRSQASMTESFMLPLAA